MGVVRERKSVCENAKNVPSNPESTVQSGYTTQDSEDEGTSQVNSPVRRLQGRQRLIADGTLNLAFNKLITRHTGHRRARRILNTRFLETLSEDYEVTLEVENKSKFQLLMEETQETNDALELLEAYEREQAANAANINLEDVPHSHDQEDDDDFEPYFRIPRKIRAAIQGRKNFQYELIKSIETELTSQLCTQGSGGDNAFIYIPQGCYERLLVHAVAKFKGFHSETLSEGDRKVVRVSRKRIPAVDWDDEGMLLCDYIVCLRAEE